MTDTSDTATHPAVRAGLVGMTFDDGPDPVWTPRILGALAAAGIKATFFVIAPRAARHPGLVEAIVEQGHEIGLHCARHLRHTETPRSIIERDTADGLRVLAGLGLRPTRWRVPWGARADWTEPVARAHRLSLVGWSADTHDWRGGSAGAMLREIEPELVGGAIVLMHDGLGPGALRDGCLETARLVGPLAEAIRRRDLEPASLAAMDAR